MKEDLRSRLSKQLIKNSLLNILEEKKIYEINVKELCDSAGVNRSTFYRHYNNISDVQDEIMDELYTIIYEANISSSNHPDNAYDYIFNALLFFEQHREYDSLLLSDNFSFDRVMSDLKDTVKNSLISSRVKDEDNYIFLFLMNGTYAIIKYWIENGRKEPSKKIADVIYKLSLNTVSK